MKLGIIGLPNAGKTTLFNALTGQKLETAAYANPISDKPNVGVVKVPDARVDRLSATFKPRKTTHAEIMCADITGFARGLSADKQKTSLFNQVWDADALIHIVRAFEDDAVMHEGAIDPLADAAALDLELIFHDLELVENRLERIEVSIKKGIGADLKIEQQALMKCREVLEREEPLRQLPLSNEERAAIGSLQFASSLPVLVVLNVAEGELAGERTEAALRQLGDFYQGKEALVFSLCGKIEMELSQLAPDEAPLFLEDLGISEPALNLVVREAYELLGLISFFTVGEDEVRAWTIRKGDSAVRAAGRIHSDIERGFIRAETIGYDDFIAAGDMSRARELGTLKLEGKDYVVADGDIINFRFNV
jgi:GTP-binding protein YchF